MQVTTKKEIINPEHYNLLTAEEKFRVCEQFDKEFHQVEIPCFNGSIRSNFEKALRSKRRLAEIYPFGFIDELPDFVDYRDLSHKELAAFVVPFLYTKASVTRARDMADLMNLSTGRDFKREQKESDELREIIKQYEEFTNELKKDVNTFYRESSKKSMQMNRMFTALGIEGFKEQTEYLDKMDIKVGHIAVYPEVEG